MMSDIWFKRYLVAWLLLFNYAFDVMRSLFGILNWNTMLTNMCIWCDMYVGTSIIWLWVNEHSASKSMPLCLEIENSYCSGGWSVIFLCILNSAIFCCSRRYEEQLRHVHLLVKERLIFRHVFPSTVPTNSAWQEFSGFKEVY